MTDTLISSYWVKRLGQFNRLYIGFSAGLDSCVLLHSLAAIPALKNKLIAVHINHGLSAKASSWAEHAKQVCHNLNVFYKGKQVSCPSEANVEAKAREARYQIFRDFLQENDALILAHHQNDQAETVLLQLFRGTGIDGLSGMLEEQPFAKGYLLRPLLNYSRSRLEDYAKNHHLHWVEDDSNQDTRFSRNFLRCQVIPLLQHKWPAVVDNITRTAKNCLQAQVNLDELALQDYPGLQQAHTTLALDGIMQLPYNRLVNILRVWFKKNNLRFPSSRIVGQIIFKLIQTRVDANPCVQWHDKIIRRYRNTLYLQTNTLETLKGVSVWTSFPQPFYFADQVLEAIPAEKGVCIPPGSLVEISYRQGGEEIVWHGQTKSLKKLMQQWDIPPWLRQGVPLIYINKQLAVIVGYAINDNFYQEHQPHTYQLTLR